MSVFQLEISFSFSLEASKVEFACFNPFEKKKGNAQFLYPLDRNFLQEGQKTKPFEKGFSFKGILFRCHFSTNFLLFCTSFLLLRTIFYT